MYIDNFAIALLVCGAVCFYAAYRLFRGMKRGG